MVVVIRNKTHVGGHHLVCNQGMLLAVFVIPVVALDFVQYQELVIVSKILYNNGFIFTESLFCDFRYCA